MNTDPSLSLWNERIRKSILFIYLFFYFFICNFFRYFYYVFYFSFKKMDKIYDKTTDAAKFHKQDTYFHKI